MPQNLVEKIASRFAINIDDPKKVRCGNYLTISPAYVMTHDNSGAVIPKFLSIGAKKIFNPRQVVFTLDHNVQDKSEKNIEKYKGIEQFANDHGLDFYPAGRGIGHQIMCEEGYAFPGSMMVASDSHSNMYGGLGCLGTPIVRTDAAAIWATGQTWWQIPPVAKVELKGKLKPGVSGKDVIIALCGMFNKDQVLNHIIEFSGDGLACLSVEQRLTIANMTTEWGALGGVFPIDNVLIDWLKRRAEFVAKRGLEGVPSDADNNGKHPRMNINRIEELEQNPILADDNASYETALWFDLTSVQPHVAGPDNVKTMNSVAKISKEKVKINKAYLMSCVNGRVEDLAEAAKVVKGKKIAKGVEFYLAAASSEVEQESKERGDWQTLLDAGCIAFPPGCGACIGLGAGTLEENEIGISATNRNFKGRMGARSAKAYLASPAVVAASAISGYIDQPTSSDDTELLGEVIPQKEIKSVAEKVQIIEGFPATIKGELIFCHQDNLNTDGIYPGKYTYIDDFTPQQQAEVVMENYDPEFGKIVKDGDILAGGFNFGSGSSREQAATALKYRGIKLVIAGSSSQTYKRNALNNGFLLIQCPELITDLKKEFKADKLTIRTGIEAVIDIENSILTTDKKKYQIAPTGIAAQELIIAGSLENWVKKKL